MGRRANSLRSYIEGSETDTPASFLTLSVLPDEELFVCIFYFKGELYVSANYRSEL